MRPLSDAQRDVLAAMTVLAADDIALADCLGLALAADVVAPHPVPPFANSAMDGFAVRASDVATVPATLDVIEDVPAGSVARHTIEPGTTIRIMTGAPMPDGADAVVIVEDSEDLPDARVSLRVAARVGDHVRPAGGDIDQGSVVLTRGSRLDATRLGLLASVGVSHPKVVRRPTVAVLSTGDELLPVEARTLRPGAIYDSNRPMLVAMLSGLGVEVLDLGIVPDDARLLRSVLGEAAANADAVLTSGGVSMGDYDLVKQVLGEMGRIDFWRVAMQPAKPFAFGFLGETPLFGLPGNPVSVMVAFEQFVRPALLRRMGSNLLFRPRSMVRAGDGFDTHPDKTVFVRVALRMDAGEFVVTPSGGQASNVLSALAAADAFAVVPVGVGSVATGEMVEVEWFRNPESRTLEEALGE